MSPLAMHSLSALPIDILSLVVSELDQSSLSRLCRCCKALAHAVNTHGWPALARRIARRSVTLRNATRKWTARDVVRHTLAVERAWDVMDSALIQIGPTWHRKCLPLLTVDETAGGLLFSTGPDLHAVGFDRLGRPFAALSRPEMIGRTANDDITGLAMVSDRSEAVIGTINGALHRVSVGHKVERLATYGVHSSVHEARSAGPIQALSVSSDLIAAISSPRVGRRAKFFTSGQDGMVSLYAVKSPWQPPVVLSLAERPWSVHLDASRGFVAVGGMGASALGVHGISPTGFSGATRQLAGPIFHSAVYALSGLHNQSPEILVSGWFDGMVRLYDLRTSCDDPILQVEDKWSEDAVYSLACTSIDRLLIGGSRHSAVRIADLRKPAIHTTLYCGNDESPIYSLAAEASRIFAVTERRALMVDFKPGAVEGCWDRAPAWAEGARPRFARAEEALRLRVYGEETRKRWARPLR